MHSIRTEERLKRNKLGKKKLVDVQPELRDFETTSNRREREMESNPEWERGQLLRNRSLVVYEKFDMALCLSGDVGNYKKHHSTRFEEVKAVDP